MNCNDAKALFLAVHDGDLDEKEVQAFFDHLEGCTACSDEWEAYQLTLTEVSGMYPLLPPKEFTQRVKQAIGKRSKGRFFGDDRHLSISFAVVSFVLIVLFLIAYLYLSSGPEITLVPPDNGINKPSDTAED